MKNQKGFTLIELLVVVVIIAIVAAIAIPNLLASRRAAYEATVIANLRTIHTAQIAYLVLVGNKTTYGDFTGLTSNQLIDQNWIDGVVKSTFTYNLTRNATNTAYCVKAISSDTNSKDYGISTDRILYYNPTNGTLGCDATAATLTGAGNSVLGN